MLAGIIRASVLSYCCERSKSVGVSVSLVDDFLGWCGWAGIDGWGQGDISDKCCEDFFVSGASTTNVDALMSMRYIFCILM